MSNIPKAANSGSDKMHLDEFDPEADDWYIMQQALEQGSDDPHSALRAFRHQPPAQADSPTSQRGNGGAAAISPLAEAARPANGWPPGRARAIAQFIFANSYSPIPDIAVTATIALLAGVCGRAYRTYTDTDTALYIILVAKSGLGKETVHEALPRLLEMAARPMANRFVRSTDFASGEALHKELLREPGFLNLAGEFGKKLKRMGNPSDTPMQNLRTVMLKAFGKRYLEGKSYSNADYSMDGVDWPALSFLGETVPSTLYECLTPDMMADGFLSRFLICTYTGDRPPPNRIRVAQLDADNLAHWGALVDHAIRYQTPFNMPDCITVQPNDDARDKLEYFEQECIDALNATDDESERQVWSRAHIKALKIASLLAIADHYLNPVIRIEHVAWATIMVRQDIEMFQSRKQSGDIGTDDDARERKLIAFMVDYSLKAPAASYKVPAGMRENYIVPRSYLQIRARSLPAFNNHKLGAKRALEDAIASCLANGYIREVKSDKLIEQFSFFGKAYLILRTQL
jgi:hypothetical protein